MENRKEVYFDNSATTRVFDSVRDVMVEAMTSDYGNTSSRHMKGVEAERYIREAREEIAEMRSVCMEAIDSLGTDVSDAVSWLTGVAALEQKMDDMTSQYRQSQLNRMKSGTCSDEGCILFSEMLTDFERIGDHVLNIAQERSGASLS